MVDTLMPRCHRMTPGANLHWCQPQRGHQKAHTVHAQFRIDENIQRVSDNAFGKKREILGALDMMIGRGTQLSDQRIFHDMRVVDEYFKYRAIKVGNPACKIIADSTEIKKTATESDADSIACNASP